MTAAVRVAIVGAGGMAREHIRAFADVSGVSVCGIHSRTRDKAASLAAEMSIPLVCDSIDELHRATRADLVIVAVPELAARAVAGACFAHPWTVMLEKPAGYNLADAEAITQAAAAGRRVYVALNRRFLSSTLAAVQDLDRQAGPRFIHVQDQQSLALARSIGHPPEVVDNWMFANSIHLVDYFHAFGRGEVVSLQRVFPYHPENAGVVVAALEFSQGDRGLYEGIWSGPGPWAVTVTTPSRRWEMRPLEQASSQSAGERRLQAADAHEWDRAFKPGFRRQAEEVIRAVRGEPSQAVTLEQANRTMRLIQAIFEPGKA